MTDSDIARAADRVRATPLREVDDSWLPIATCPREAERVLLWCADLRKPGVPVGVTMGSIWSGKPYGNGMNGDWTFTHWMPLPAPPSES
jgi:hypothetical protein